MLIRNAAPKNLSCLGFLSPADDFLAAIDVYVQPSFTEGLSLSLLEAMRAALPIVATNVGATAKAVRNGREAIFVRPAPDDILAAVGKMRADPAMRTRMGAAARLRFDEEFRMEIIERTYAAVYALAASRGR
jgi:glycosyltransferase involved in cell wall biosynthesis